MLQMKKIISKLDESQDPTIVETKMMDDDEETLEKADQFSTFISPAKEFMLSSPQQDMMSLEKVLLRKKAAVKANINL